MVDIEKGRNGVSETLGGGIERKERLVVSAIVKLPVQTSAAVLLHLRTCFIQRYLEAVLQFGF